MGFERAARVNDDFEELHGPIPGPHTRELATHLRAVEARNVTYLADDFPIFWESASEATVTDVDQNRYIDLTAAFGVAAIGHSNAYVVAAVHDQAVRLMHGMGDVHPTEVRTRLLEALPRVLPTGLDRTFLATTGSEAVEAAMKTAVLATGKSHFIAFRGAYHGLAPGALALCGIEKFRTPFEPIVAGVTTFVDYPDVAKTDAPTALAALADRFDDRDDIAAVFIEPIQGRGGCVVPASGYLSGLRAWCSKRRILLVADEVYTGFGRTGTWFACDHERIVPDLMCIGKAMGSGFPVSALVGRQEIMDAWPVSSGEALHTSTYLGNPMGCAAALATIHEIERAKLPDRARELGNLLGPRLQSFTRHPGVRAVRGRGLMWGVVLSNGEHAERVVKAALARGVIILQAGPEGDVISLTPPLVITQQQLMHALDIIEGVL
jgi:4-aminobutyrate aminotransferase/(S)-3-amino-2-methylpropionate transaminase